MTSRWKQRFTNYIQALARLEELAKNVAENIRNEYIVLFRELAETLKPAFELEDEL
jgi:uncharacterized protein YdhG (YjbR/CyaY superfamily)